MDLVNDYSAELIQGDQFESGKSIKLFLALPVELGPSFFGML